MSPAKTLRAEQAGAAMEFRALIDKVRLLYGVDFLPSDGMRILENRCRHVWEKRALIAQQLEPGGDPDWEHQVRADLLDLAILWADLRVLDEAEAAFGWSPVLAYERQVYLAVLQPNQSSQAEPSPLPPANPRTAWECYVVGRSLLRDGRCEEASENLARAVELQPQGLWPLFYSGVCAYRLGQYGDAVTSFTACAALAPEVAGFFHNRALAYAALGHFERAGRDYDRTLALDPALAAAALNRGMIHYRAHRYPQAAADFQQALGCGADPALGYYNLALVQLTQGQRAAALASLEHALARQPDHQEARTLYANLQQHP